MGSQSRETAKSRDAALLVFFIEESPTTRRSDDE